TVFLLLLCNDKQVLGPWVNGKATNIFAVVVIGILVMLSVILTVSVLFPGVSSGQIMSIMIGFASVATLTAAAALLRSWRRRLGSLSAGPDVFSFAAWSGEKARASTATGASPSRDGWRMPPIAMLAPVQMSLARRLGMSAMWAYLGLVIILVIVRVVELAL